MTKGIEDFKVACDTKVNDDLAPAGLKIWNEVRVVGPSAFDRINVRRVFIMLWDSRQPLPDSKISRRSRRRWRGKGGVWLFDPRLKEAFCRSYAKLANR